MLSRHSLRAALAALLLACPALLAASAPTPSGAAFAHEGSDLAADPAIRWGRLDNGLRYAILPNKEPKGRASLRITFAAGSLHETEEQRGLAHFLEHMAFNGSRNFPPGTLVEYFQRLGMGFGNDTNAFTSFDRTSYQLELPDTQEATLAKALTLFGDYLGGLLLQDAEIDKERGIILAEKVARDSIEFRQFIGEFEYLLPESRFIHRIPIGTEEVITKASRPQFVDYYDTWYRPDLATIVAVGDFDPDLVEWLVRAQFAPAAARAPARPVPNLGRVTDAPGVTARFLPEPKAAAVQVAVQVVRPYTPEPDTAAARLKYLPRRLALSMVNRRLSILAKQEGAPFLSGQVGATEQFDFFHNASIELTCKPDQWRAALTVAEQELRRALEHGFQAAELREASAGLRNALEQAVRTAPTRRSEGLANALAGALVDHEVFTHPSADLALYGPALAKVTVEDCLRALRETWAPEFGRRLWMTGNLALDQAETQMVAAFEASRAVAVTPPAKIEDAAFAYTDFGPAGTVAGERQVEDLGISLLTFANGVRLNLKPTDFEAGRVRVSVRVGGGRLTEPKDLPGLTFLASNTFLAGGTGRHGVDDLQRILAGRTVGTNFSIAADAFTFSGTTNRADLLLQLQLICAHLADPGFRPEAMRQYAKGVEVFYTRLGNVVEGPLQLEAPRLLAAGDPRFGVPPREAAVARTQDEAKAWLVPEFKAGALEVAIVGDFDPAEARTAVAKTFGALPPRQPKPAYDAERVARFAPEAVTREFFTVTEIPKGIVQLFWEATDSRDANVARRLNLLGAVLDDRLRVKIREEMGDTYSPSAGAMLSDTFRGYGHLMAGSTVSPDKARPVADAIRRIAADLHANGVTEEELVRAKQPALTSIRQSMRTNPYWLGSVLSAAQEQPERIEWARTRLSGTEAITAAELSDFAKRFLRPEKVHEFLSLPTPKKAD
jgi:zinc protease